MKNKIQKNTSKNFNVVTDIDIDLRLKYLYAFTDFMQYKLDNSKGSIDYTYLN
ncbi:hypothetical protein [Flavobacterium aquicola]|uniref:Uncharacterized protein n=1 Tax=Flavobacterium aquicola TaxID=1682742 RepID=A0A3E0E5S8_9FLAO|nr:hypothetical protein [Flavobacterium aquicola]REG93000.1 hypothetical protein C8P67_114101 [Flavobacterium aquicola]